MSGPYFGATTCYMAQAGGRGVAYEFWRRVEAERASRGWTKSELAQRTGVPISTLNRLRDSARAPYARTVNTVAKALGIDQVDAAKLAGIVPGEDEAVTEPVNDAVSNLDDLDDIDFEIEMIRGSDLPRSQKEAMIREAMRLRDRQRQERKAIEERQVAERRSQVETWIDLAGGTQPAT